MKSLVLFLSLLTCFSVEATAFSVLTYNVNYHFINEDIVDVLDSINAEVVCLQETNAAWESIIRMGLKDKYPFIQFKHIGTAGGLAILSKYPVVKSDVIANEHGWFPTWIVTIKKGEDAIQIMNTHLKPGLTKKGRIGWNAYFKAEEVHVKELKEFVKSLNPKLPAIILGDFNESDKGKATKWLMTEGFEDALPKFNKSVKTWRFMLLKGRYDHLTFNNKLICTKAMVYKLGKSDHFPLLGVFELNRACL